VSVQLAAYRPGVRVPTLALPNTPCLSLARVRSWLKTVDPPAAGLIARFRDEVASRASAVVATGNPSKSEFAGSETSPYAVQPLADIDSSGCGAAASRAGRSTNVPPDPRSSYCSPNQVPNPLAENGVIAPSLAHTPWSDRETKPPS
jgi:hypothetical protein